MFHSSRTTRKAFDLFLVTLLGALLAAAPAFAADPEEADPDPGAPATQSSGVIVLNDPSELDTTRLAPGRYIVWIVDAGGVRATYEIVVEP